MKCYHHSDADGRCAGAIVYQSILAKENIEMIEVDYKDVIDINAIEPGELIYIVDFSFKPNVMQEILKKTKVIIWIDHHKTAMEYDYGEALVGSRDNAASGCELTWRYINHSKLPEGVALIGDYDTWTFKYGDRTKYFHIGIETHNTKPDSIFWEDLFKDNPKMIEDIIKEGITCDTYRTNLTAAYRKSFGFETEFAGYNCYALNLYKLGSKAFGDKNKKYDICLSFVFDGNKWTVGLYSEKVDVGKLAQKYGGGGHTGAAGIICDSLPFHIKT